MLHKNKISNYVHIITTSAYMQVFPKEIHTGNLRKFKELFIKALAQYSKTVHNVPMFGNWVRISTREYTSNLDFALLSLRVRVLLMRLQGKLDKAPTQNHLEF